MSIAIIGGNECMTREYKNLCSAYNCKARVYPKMCGGMKHLGSPDLLVLFTGTVSHKMVRCALNEARSQNTRVVRIHSSSIAALKSALEEHLG